MRNRHCRSRRHRAHLRGEAHVLRKQLGVLRRSGGDSARLRIRPRRAPGRHRFPSAPPAGRANGRLSDFRLLTGYWYTEQLQSSTGLVAGAELTELRHFSLERNGMLRAVIFDLDGVIVDSHPAHLQAWKRFFRSIDKDVTDTDLEFVLEGYKREVILRHFLGELSAGELKYYGERKDALFRGALDQVRPVTGFDAFFQSVQAAGLPVALASSASR